MTDMIEPVKIAVEKAGNVARLARELGVPRPNLYTWRRVPAHHVHILALITSIPPHLIRPDIFPEPEEYEKAE